MGLAFILAGCDFSGKNLGQVTPLQDVPVTAIEILGGDSYSGISVILTVAYTPVVSNQKGVSWSISSGGTYATINESTGELTIFEGADNAAVTVRATSIYDNKVYGEKTVSVTYAETVEELTAIAIEGPDTVKNNARFSIVTTPVNSAYKGVSWSIVSGAAYATINESTGVLTVLDGASDSEVTIQAVSTHDAAITATKTVSVSYEAVNLDLTDKVLRIEKPKLGENCTILLEIAEPTVRSGYNNLMTGDITVKGSAGPFAITAKGNASRESAIVSAGGSQYRAVATGNKYSLEKGTYLINNAGWTSPWGTFARDTSALEAETEGDYLILNLNMNNSAYASWDKVTASNAAHNGDDVYKVAKLILFADTLYTTVADVLEHRSDADIDLQFDADGQPYNAGTSGATFNIIQ